MYQVHLENKLCSPVGTYPPHQEIHNLLPPKPTTNKLHTVYTQEERYAIYLFICPIGDAWVAEVGRTHMARVRPIHVTNPCLNI